MDRAARTAFILGLVVLAFGSRVSRPWLEAAALIRQLKPIGDTVQAATCYFTDADLYEFSPSPSQGRRSDVRTALPPPLRA